MEVCNPGATVAVLWLERRKSDCSSWRVSQVPQGGMNIPGQRLKVRVLSS